MIRITGSLILKALSPHLLGAVLTVVLLAHPPSVSWGLEVGLEPAPGIYRDPLMLTISVPPDVRVHFTLDGSEPSLYSAVYRRPVRIEKDTVVRYFTVDPMGVRGKVLEAFYRIEGTRGPEEGLRTTVDPPGGSYSDRIIVRLDSSVGATIYYTIDGSEPDTSSSIFTTPLILSGDTHLRFFAVGLDGVREPLREERYVFQLVSRLVDTTPPTVRVAPAPEDYRAGDRVRIEANEDSTIYYTTDGSEPTEDSEIFTEPVLLRQNTVLRFFGVDRQGNRSGEQTAEYTVDNVPPTVTASPQAGLQRPPLLARLVSSEEDATVYFTLDGSMPDEGSEIYHEPIVLVDDTIVRFFALDAAGNRGEVSEVRYTIDGTPPRTAVNPPEGQYKPPVTVTLETEEGARIYYSLDGRDPDPDSPVYTSSFTFHEPVILKFYAVDGVGNQEPIQTHRYGFINGVWRKYARGVFLIPSVTNGRTFWMGSEAGLVVYHVGSGSRKFVGEREGLVGNRINDLILDEEGNLWIATEEGVNRQDKGGGFTHIGSKDGLPDEEVLAIGVDVDGSVWAGTSRGVANIRDGVVYEVYRKRDGLVDDHVLSITVDALGNKWFGTRKGLSKFTGAEWRNFTRDSGLVDNEIRTVAIDRDWKVWCGTSRGISVFDGQGWTTHGRSNGLPSIIIDLIAPDPDGEIWVATKAGVARFDGEKWIKEESP